MISETSKNYINHLLSVALSDLQLTSQLDSLDITTPDPRFGDYSTNAALVMSKKLKVNPKALAEKIIGEIKKADGAKKLLSVEEKGGFINFTLAGEFLLENLSNIIAQRELYGCSIVGKG